MVMLSNWKYISLEIQNKFIQWNHVSQIRIILTHNIYVCDDNFDNSSF